MSYLFLYLASASLVVIPWILISMFLITLLNMGSLIPPSRMGYLSKLPLTKYVLAHAWEGLRAPPPFTPTSQLSRCTPPLPKKQGQMCPYPSNMYISCTHPPSPNGFFSLRHPTSTLVCETTKKVKANVSLPIQYMSFTPSPKESYALGHTSRGL
jgi:hypothetical protein